MEFSDILAKIANNARLTPQEMDFLKRTGDETQRRNNQGSSLFAADSRVKLDSPVISSPYFSTDALAPMLLTKTIDTAITTGTDTYVEFENLVYPSKIFSWGIADAATIFLNYTGQGFQFVGRLAWAANATGYRNVKLRAYNQDGTQIGDETLIANQGFAGSDNVFPFSFVVAANQFATMKSLRFMVGQTSGGNLNLLFCNLAIFAI